jgi:hypothetical protein
MAKLKVATAAVLSFIVAAPVMAQNEMKGQEGGAQRPTETQSPASKTAPAEKMKGEGQGLGPQGQGQGEGYGKGEHGKVQGQKAGEKGEMRKDSERMTPSQMQRGAAGEKAGATSEKEKTGAASEKTGTTGEKAGAASEKAGTMSGKAGTTGEKAGTMGEKAGTTGEKAGNANITTEQRSQIVTEFRNSNVREAKNLHINSVRIGAAVPHNVTEYWVPVPATIIETVPAWRSYRAVKIGEEILIINPANMEIVYVLT